MSTTARPSTQEILAIISDIFAPLARLERTMVMPFDRARHENVAEHSFMLGLVACAVAEQLDTSLDCGLVAQYALVHDVVEAYAGDTTVWATAEELAAKRVAEQAALQRVARDFASFPWITRTIEAYERRNDAESRFVYALDKMLSHMLIIVGDYHPLHPTKAAYLRTEKTARGKMSAYPQLLPYFEELCEQFRASPHFFKDSLTE